MFFNDTPKKKKKSVQKSYSMVVSLDRCVMIYIPGSEYTVFANDLVCLMWSNGAQKFTFGQLLNAQNQS